MRDNLQARLDIPWNWLAACAAIALLLAGFGCPPPVPFWATWLGLFVCLGSGALCISWCNWTIVYPMALVMLFAFAHCLSPLYCYWFPKVLDFEMTSRFEETFIFCQVGSGIYLLTTVLAMAKVPRTRTASFELNKELAARIHRWSVMVYVGAVLIQLVASRTGAIPAFLNFFVSLIGDLRHVAVCTLI